MTHMKAESYQWPASNKTVVGGTPTSDPSPFGAWGAHAAGSEADEPMPMWTDADDVAAKMKNLEMKMSQTT